MMWPEIKIRLETACCTFWPVNFVAYEVVSFVLCSKRFEECTRPLWMGVKILLDGNLVKGKLYYFLVRKLLLSFLPVYR